MSEHDDLSADLSTAETMRLEVFDEVDAILAEPDGIALLKKALANLSLAHVGISHIARGMARILRAEGRGDRDPLLAAFETIARLSNAELNPDYVIGEIEAITQRKNEGHHWYDGLR